MWGRSLLLVAALAAATSMLLPRPALTSSAPAAAVIHIHHGGGGNGGIRNPANALVAAVNANRTAARLPALRSSKGLGCMALQYLAHCLDDDGTELASCHPPERDVTEVYAANCGVELPTVDLVSARLLGCFTQGQDDSSVLVIGANASTTAAVLRGRQHTQVGAGILRQRRHGPDFWCLLFSAGKPGTTFRLEAAGRGIAQPHGCFSEPDKDALPCSSAGGRLLTSSMPLLLLLPLLVLALAL